MAPLTHRSAFGALVFALAVAAPSLATSEQVHLKSSDGTLNVEGVFVDYQNEVYTIKTDLGNLRVKADGVRCEGAACPVFESPEADLVIKGSDTVGVGLMPLLLAGYASHLDAEASIGPTRNYNEAFAELVGDGGYGDDIGSILVTSTNTSDGFDQLRAANIDIAMASRRIQPTEARALKSSGAGNMIDATQEHIVAIDSLVVIVHPSNPVEKISIDQLRDIYAGRLTNWRALGGNDAPITVIDRPNSSATHSVFYDGIFLDEAPEEGAGHVIVEGVNEMAASVNEDANAIGYTGFAFQRGAKALPLINDCGMLTEPDAFSVKVEEYALQRRLYLYNRADVDDVAKEFINYALSSNADGVIAKSGFIDLGVTRKSQEMSGARARALLNQNVDAYEGDFMLKMLAEMKNYDRLSTTFRFRTGSSKLDERGRFDMARLADFLEEQPDGTRVRFVGFTDNVGAFESNRQLSLGRAEQVIEQLKEFAGDRIAGIEIAASGYGEIAPSACNSSEGGRAINRRVEVWIEAAQQG